MANRLTRAKSNWAASSPRLPGIKKAMRFEIRIRLLTQEPSKLPKSLESASIWNLADLHFPGAVQIVDLYHARQHLWDLARKLYPNDTVSQKTWIKIHQKRLLDKG